MHALFVLVALFGTATYLGGRDLWLASSANTEPDKLTVKQVIARGVEGNPYVEVSEFVIGDNFVYEAEADRWRTVWVPIGPLEDIDKPLASVKIVLKSNKMKSESAVAQMTNVPRLKGMIMNRIESLGSSERQILASSYPSTNPEAILILELDRDPASMMKMGGAFFAVGITGLLITAVVGVRQWRRTGSI